VSELARFKHDPRSLLDGLPDRWPGEALRAAVIIVTDAEGRSIWDASSYSKQEVLWAMEKFKHEILFGRDDD